MEDIKNIPQKELKKAFLIDIINSINDDKNLTQFAHSKSISPQKLNYYIRYLKNQGIIKKIGYGVWELTETGKNYTRDTFKKEVRAHAFIWTIKLPNKIDWKTLLIKSQIKYELIGNTGTPRIYINHRKVWLGTKNIVIYEPLSFISITPLEARKLAVINLIELIKIIESKFNLSLKTKEGYLFHPKREHYALMKNNLAIQCRKDRTKLYVQDKDGLWMCCDDSYNLDEAEFFTTNKTSGLVNGSKAQGFFNEQKETNWEVSPKFVLKVMNGIQQNQLIFDKNMQSHIQAIQTLSRETKRLGKIMRGVLSENIQLKLSNKHQSTLGSFT